MTGGTQRKRLFFAYNGDKLPIIVMYDIDDNVTDDPTLATRLIALLPNNWELCAPCTPERIVLGKLN